MSSYIKSIAKVLDGSIDDLFKVGDDLTEVGKQLGKLRTSLAEALKKGDDLDGALDDWLKKNKKLSSSVKELFEEGSSFRKTLENLEKLKGLGKKLDEVLVGNKKFDVSGDVQKLLDEVRPFMEKGGNRFAELERIAGEALHERTTGINRLFISKRFRKQNPGLDPSKPEDLAKLRANAVEKYNEIQASTLRQIGRGIAATPGVVGRGIGTGAGVSWRVLKHPLGASAATLITPVVFNALFGGKSEEDVTAFEGYIGSIRATAIGSDAFKEMLLVPGSSLGDDAKYHSYYESFQEMLVGDASNLSQRAAAWKENLLRSPERLEAYEIEFLNSKKFDDIVSTQGALNQLAASFSFAYRSDLRNVNIDKMWAEMSKGTDAVLTEVDQNNVKNLLQTILEERENGIKDITKEDPTVKGTAAIHAYLASIGLESTGFTPAPEAPAPRPQSGQTGDGDPQRTGGGGGGNDPQRTGGGGGGNDPQRTGGGGGSRPAPIPTFTGVLADDQREAFTRMQKIDALVNEVGVSFLNGDGNASNGLAAVEIIAQSRAIQISLNDMAGKLRAENKADEASKLDAFSARYAQDALKAEEAKTQIDVLNEGVKALQKEAKDLQDKLKELNKKSQELQGKIDGSETKIAEKTADAEKKIEEIEKELGVKAEDIKDKSLEERIDNVETLIGALTDQEKKTELTGKMAAVEGAVTVSEASEQEKAAAKVELDKIKEEASQIVEQIGAKLVEVAQKRDDAEVMIIKLRDDSARLSDELRQDDNAKTLFRDGNRPGGVSDAVASFAGEHNLISGLLGSDGDDPSILKGVSDTVVAGIGDIGEWWSSVKRGATSKEEAMIYNAMETGGIVIGGMAAWNIVKNLSSAIGVDIPKGVSWAVVGLIAVFALKRSGIIGAQMADDIAKNLRGDLVVNHGQGTGAHNPPRPHPSLEEARRAAGITTPVSGNEKDGADAEDENKPDEGADSEADKMTAEQVRTALGPTYAGLLTKFQAAGVSPDDIKYGAVVSGALEANLIDLGLQDSDIPKVKEFLEKLGQDIIDNGKTPAQADMIKSFYEEMKAAKEGTTPPVDPNASENPTAKQVREAGGLFISIDDRKIRTFTLDANGIPQIGEAIELSSEGQKYVEDKMDEMAGRLQGKAGNLPAAFYPTASLPLESVVGPESGTGPGETFTLRTDLKLGDGVKITAGT